MSTAKTLSKLEDIFTGEHLPALPDSAIRLLEVSQDPENGPPEFAVPIEADLGLTGQVLRFVNSSYFGFSREISSVQLAIALVGVKTIKNFALWSAVFSLMPNPKCGPFDLRHLWQDSLRRGLFARQLGRIQGLREAEDLFSAALLQDMAVPLLAKQLPEDYAEMLETCRQSDRRLSELETERFGWNHAEAGAHLARHWRLPAHFADYIRQHSQLEKLLNSGQNEAACLVGLSALLPSSVDECWHDRVAFESAYERLGGSRCPELSQLFAELDETCEEFAPLMRVRMAGPTLSQWLRAPVA